MELLDFTIKLAEKAGKLVLKERKKPLQISKKGIRDLVTQADYASEKLIIDSVKKKFPNHEFIAEESVSSSLTKLKKAPYIWIIDPIDGTTNFTKGLPQFAISIGIFKNSHAESSKNFDYLEGELVVGVVYAPALGEMFYAEKGGGAFLNGKKIKVSDTTAVIDSLMATGFSYKDKLRNLPYVEVMMEKSRGIRRFGAASLDMCYAAAGLFDGYWEFGLKAWDIAAGALIIEEAGGQVTDVNGNQLDLFGGDIMASNKKIHKEMIQAFSKINWPPFS